MRVPESVHRQDPSDGDTRDRIATRAYELYLARGGNHGADFDDWITAERELTGAHSGSDRE